MRLLTPILCALVLAAPGVALAQTSGDEGYGGTAGINRQIESADRSGGEPSDDRGGLPFSGSDLIVLAATGGALLLIGFTLRRLTHSPTRDARRRSA